MDMVCMKSALFWCTYSMRFIHFFCVRACVCFRFVRSTFLIVTNRTQSNIKANPLKKKVHHKHYAHFYDTRERRRVSATAARTLVSNYKFMSLLAVFCLQFRITCCRYVRQVGWMKYALRIISSVFNCDAVSSFVFMLWKILCYWYFSSRNIWCH